MVRYRSLHGLIKINLSGSTAISMSMHKESFSFISTLSIFTIATSVSVQMESPLKDILLIWRDRISNLQPYIALIFYNCTLLLISTLQCWHHLLKMPLCKSMMKSDCILSYSGHSVWNHSCHLTSEMLQPSVCSSPLWKPISSALKNLISSVQNNFILPKLAKISNWSPRIHQKYSTYPFFQIPYQRNNKKSWPETHSQIPCQIKCLQLINSANP